MYLLYLLPHLLATRFLTGEGYDKVVSNDFMCIIFNGMTVIESNYSIARQHCSYTQINVTDTLWSQHIVHFYTLVIYTNKIRGKLISSKDANDETHN